MRTTFSTSLDITIERVKMGVITASRNPTVTDRVEAKTAQVRRWIGAGGTHLLPCEQ